MTQTVRLELPPKLIPVFTGDARYRGAYGGRGSGKSFSFAKMLAVRGMIEPIKILCCRELQKSIRDSVHAEVRRAIESEPWLESHYEIGESFIRGKNGTEFLFRGLKHNISEIKSMAGVKIAWVEEAEIVSEESWQLLIPTIREENSEIWLTWNPKDEHSPTNLRFLHDSPHRSKIVQLNYNDNPWFPDVLREEMESDRRRGSIFFNHIWEGGFLDSSGGIFDSSWIKWVKMSDVPPCRDMVWFFDMAYSEDEKADRSAGLITARANDGRIFQFGHYVGRHQYPVMKQKIIELTGKYPKVRRIGIDSTMSQVGYLNDLQTTRELAGFSIVGKRHNTNKIQNAMPYISRCESGIVHWVDSPMAREFIKEMGTFSDDCLHDDCMDASANGYEMVSKQTGVTVTSAY